MNDKSNYQSDRLKFVSENDNRSSRSAAQSMRFRQKQTSQNNQSSNQYNVDDEQQDGYEDVDARSRIKSLF